jgi:CubicO group peptidase (beta-lactamase class C family)
MHRGVDTLLRILSAATVALVAPAAVLATPGAPVLQLDAVGLQWSPVASCTGYDAVRGGLGDLLATGGDFAAATSLCGANNLTVTALPDTDAPAAGEGFWYLVRAVTCHAAGSWDSGGPSQLGSRDAEIAASAVAGACDALPDPGEDGKIGIVRSFVQSHHGPAQAGIAIVSDGVLQATTGIGGANGQTIFWIASTSKFVTSVGAVTLMQQGLLDQNAAVTAYVPDYTENNGLQDQIVIEHLLQNRSGLPQDGGCADFACRQDLLGDATTTQYDLMVPDRGATLGNIFKPGMLAKVPYSIFNVTSFAPGSGYQYAGWGFMLAGRAMETAAGETFDLLMQHRVLDPAGMCRATYDGAAVDANAALGTGWNAIDGWCPEPMLPRGHQGEGQPYYHDELDCAARMPQGGLHASALDVGRLAEAVLADLGGAGRVTAAAAMHKVFCPDGGQGLPGSPGSTCLGRGQVTGEHAALYGLDYGFGNFRRTYVYGGRTYDLYNHGGGRAGFSSYFAIVPEAGFAVAVLVNSDGASAWHDVAECAIRVYLHGASSC